MGTNGTARTVAGATRKTTVRIAEKKGHQAENGLAPAAARRATQEITARTAVPPGTRDRQPSIIRSIRS